jgi:hypothetical protein
MEVYMRLLAMLGLIFSTQLFAAEPGITITSFTYTGAERKLAELCGTVNNMTKVPTYVRVTVDHTSDRPATYNTLVGSNGKFCLAVITYHGTANARVWE